MTAIRVSVEGTGVGPVEMGEVSHEHTVTVCLNGQPVLGIDLFYLNPENVDPTDTTAGEPHYVIGHWPNGEDWERLTAGTLDDKKEARWIR